MSPPPPTLRAVEARLAFARPENVHPDAQRPGLLRARTLDTAVTPPDQAYDLRTCRVLDCAALDDFEPDIRVHGFGYLDLSAQRRLQDALERIRQARHLQAREAHTIRGLLERTSFALARGARLRILYIAREGLFMRRAGPNGMTLEPDTAPEDRKNHDAAQSVHADQDVEGTPLRQILGRTAPWLFHHDSPRRANTRSPLFLLNLWIPLDQISRPLGLMDTRTLNRPAHQLCYGLPTEGILERDSSMRVNDIWSFLHDPAQQWYYTSQMGPERAYIFETLGTPHASFVLPGEDIAEQRYQQLSAASRAIRAGDAAALRRATPPHAALQPSASVPRPLRQALSTMAELVAEAHTRADVLCQGEGCREEESLAWCSQADQAMERVVRKSLELRVVGLITPGQRR